jgi:hypothetical protein
MTVARRTGPFALVVLAACGGGAGGGSTQWQGTPRPLASLPQSARFMPDAAFHGSGATLRTDACLTHLIDPTNSVRLTLVRSVGGDAQAAAKSAGVSTNRNPQGDFSTEPQFQYGLRSGELLRVDCATGRALGAVER